MSPPSPEDRAKASTAAAGASWADVAQEVEDVEVLLHALRGQYEQYFMGIEKRPPVWAHEQFRKRLTALKTVPSRNSALSFRIQSLQASAVTFERLWSRTMQEIENGTYRRDLFKARMRRKSSDVPAAQGATSAPASSPEAKSASPGKTASAKPATPESAPLSSEPQIHIAGTPPPDPLAETRLRSVYRAYVEAKRRCNEDTTRLSFDAVVASLKRQVPELLERHNARDVEYRVFVKDGKAILRAVPKI
ncbi:MAG TPA: MXAN_5187 C-terminal domain-containing protein [Myxococcaceae bacterium]|nr:MXAN_5187 C-terminal domain-containing protein [Myxococcaceae bacterium]